MTKKHYNSCSHNNIELFLNDSDDSDVEFDSTSSSKEKKCSRMPCKLCKSLRKNANDVELNRDTRSLCKVCCVRDIGMCFPAVIQFVSYALWKR